MYIVSASDKLAVERVPHIYHSDCLPDKTPSQKDINLYMKTIQEATISYQSSTTYIIDWDIQ